MYPSHKVEVGLIETIRERFWPSMAAFFTFYSWFIFVWDYTNNCNPDCRSGITSLWWPFYMAYQWLIMVPWRALDWASRGLLKQNPTTSFDLYYIGVFLLACASFAIASRSIIWSTLYSSGNLMLFQIGLFLLDNPNVRDEHVVNWQTLNFVTNADILIIASVIFLISLVMLWVPFCVQVIRWKGEP